MLGCPHDRLDRGQQARTVLTPSWPSTRLLGEPAAFCQTLGADDPNRAPPEPTSRSRPADTLGTRILELKGQLLAMEFPMPQAIALQREKNRPDVGHDRLATPRDSALDRRQTVRRIHRAPW